MPTVANSRRSRPRAAVPRLADVLDPVLHLREIRMIRRSVSSWLSPGPRVPMPPWPRHGSRAGSGGAAGTRAGRARPGGGPRGSGRGGRRCRRISRLRSMTLTFSRLSSAFCWLGDSSSSAMSTLKPVSLFARPSSSVLDQCNFGSARTRARTTRPRQAYDWKGSADRQE